MNVLHGPMQGPIGGFTVGGTRTAAAGGGPALLAGDNTTPSAFTGISSSEFYYTYLAKTAVASGTPATIKVYIGTSITANNIVAAIYNSSNAKIAETSATAIVENAWVTCTVTGSPGSITSGQTYRIGFVADGNLNMGCRATSWESSHVASTYPAVPATIDPDNENGAAPEPAIYVMS